MWSVLKSLIVDQTHLVLASGKLVLKNIAYYHIIINCLYHQAYDCANNLQTTAAASFSVAEPKFPEPEEPEIPEPRIVVSKSDWMVRMPSWDSKNGRINSV